MHNTQVKWVVSFHEEFDPEFEALPEVVQDELLAHAKLLEQFGPQLGRPRVDTLNGSRHANMKELRFDAANGVWRVAFAFDPEEAGHSFGLRRQIRWRRKTVLPPAHRQSGRTV